MKSILILNAKVVNENQIIERDVLVKDGIIEQIDQDLSGKKADVIIDGEGQWLIPGVIDDQVHFREPGLTDKADIHTESRAAVAGGVTSFMEMPNTIPPTVNQELLQEKYDIASNDSLANYSFYMGATNTNIDEVLKTDPENVCGIKVFMGSSTGNMLVDDIHTLDKLFSEAGLLIATHCEDEATIRKNIELYRMRYKENIPVKFHPYIRSEEACYLSSSMAVSLAKTHNTRLHVLHISTERETKLFNNTTPLAEKKITSEACVHHLWFDESYYREKGMFIKWNPAIKTKNDKEGIFKALLEGRIDVIATDHAPHTLEEKKNNYMNAPSGGPLVQHSLNIMLEFYRKGKITLEQVVEKMCHNPAIIFNIEKRGFVREGYHADIVLIKPENPWTVEKENLLYKCKWSPFEGQRFNYQVTHTIVSGHLAYEEGNFDDSVSGQRLKFLRN